MPKNQEQKAGKARVFISYSRADLERAEALRANLIAAGFDAYLDKHDIAPGEPWRERLGALIQSAAKVVFLVSPDSAASEICAWEVAHAESLGKTILPVVVRETPPATVPALLQRLNFIFMRDDAERATAAPALLTALEIDLGWEREKTRIGDLALNWDRRGRAAHLLLSGDAAIRAAEDWRDSHPATSPPPTPLQREFIARSRDRHIRRRRYMIGGGVALAVALSVAGFVAVDQRRRAAEARISEFVAESGRLAGEAQQAMAEGDYPTAMLLALSGLPDETRPPADGGPPRPLVAEARRVLQTALRLNREEVVIPIDRRAVFDVAYSPRDPARIATASERRVEIWDVEARERKAVLSGHARPVTTVAFDPGGARVVTGSEDGVARVWNADTGAEIARLEGAASNILHAAFSPDGARVATVSTLDAPVVQIWDAGGGPPLATLALGGAEARSVAFGEGGALLVATSEGAVWIGDARAPAIEPRRITEAAADFAALSPDGARAAVIEPGANAVRVVEMAHPARSILLAGHSDTVFRAAFSPDGARIATASRDGAARIWDAATGAELAWFRTPGSLVNAAAWSPDGARIVTAGSDGAARVWRAAAARPETWRLAGLRGRSADLALLPDGRWRVAGLAGEAIGVWTGAADAATTIAAGPDVRHVDLSADGARLAAAFADGAVSAWSAGGEALTQGLRLGGTPLVVALSADGAHLAAASDREVRGWRLTGAGAAPLPAAEAGAVSLAFAAGGDRLFAALTDGATRAWGLDAGAAPEPPPCPPETAVHLIVAGGPGLVACASGGRALIRRPGTPGAAATRIAGHKDAIEHAAFSADGGRIVTIARGPTDGPDGDAPLRIWDAATGGELARFTDLLDNPADGLARAAFAPSGDAVVTLSLAGVVGRLRVFARTQDLVDEAKRVVPRCLTEEQRAAAALDAESQAWCHTRFPPSGE